MPVYGNSHAQDGLTEKRQDAIAQRSDPHGADVTDQQNRQEIPLSLV